MKLMGGDMFIAQLRAYRYAWLDGHVGAGKTSFVVALGEHMAMNYGYRFCSNIPVVFNEDQDEIHVQADGMAHVFMMLDEAGMFIPSGQSAKQFMGFLAKLDIFIVLASAMEPPPIMRAFQVEPVISFLKIGIPWIVYRWMLKKGHKNDTGTFIWLDATLPWGWYSRQYPAVDPGGLDVLMERLVQELVTYHDETKKVSNLFTLSPADAAALMADAAAEMAQAASRMEVMGAKQGAQKKRFALRRRR